MSNYFGYLLAIGFIVGAAAACVALLLRARGKKRAGMGREPVTCGSISVFFDGAGNATIIPYVKDRFGSGKATAEVVALKASCGAARLGGAVRTSLNGCRDAAPCSNDELFKKLGTADWPAFSLGRRNISIYYKENYGIIFNTTSRKADGVYEFNYYGAERSLPPDADDGLLGGTLLELLQKCR